MKAMGRQDQAVAREPETAITDAVVGSQEFEEANRQTESDPLLASIPAALTSKHDGTDEPALRSFDIA